MIYQARTESNEMFISMYETEEPKLIDCPVWNRWQDSGQFKIDHYKWQSSKREYKMRDEDVDSIKELLFNEITKNEISIAGDGGLNYNLQKGIDCTFLKDRLELEDVPIPTVVNMFGGSSVVTAMVKQWTLIPLLEDKKENEAVEFAEWIFKSGYRINARGNYYHEDDFYRDGIYTTAELYQIFKNPNKQD